MSAVVDATPAQLFYLNFVRVSFLDVSQDPLAGTSEMPAEFYPSIKQEILHRLDAEARAEREDHPGQDVYWQQWNESEDSSLDTLFVGVLTRQIRDQHRVEISSSRDE